MPIKLLSISIARSDFGRMLDFYEVLLNSTLYEIELIVGGAHFDQSLGSTINDVKKEFKGKIHFLSDSSLNPGDASSLIISDVYKILLEQKPDGLLILGDRFEMLAAAQAALLAQIPIIHIGGGYITLGAFDNYIRNALSKLSHIHLVPSLNCADNLLKMNESKSRVFICGAPELDTFKKTEPLERNTFYGRVKLDPNKDFILATFHPETLLDAKENLSFTKNCYDALINLDMQILITAPCADPNHEVFLDLCLRLSEDKADCSFVPNLGLINYISALKYCTLLLGNSSSGIIEAATTKTPVVNVGNRQKNREHTTNVIHSSFNVSDIKDSIKIASSKNFKEMCQSVKNPYGDGNFSTKAIEVLDSLSWPLSLLKNDDFIH